jgi:hypothetical protein
MKEDIKKAICDKRQEWSDRGGIISGCTFMEIEQPDKTKQVLRCSKCGFESVGYYQPKTN